MGEVIEIGDATFAEVVERSRALVLVDFTAEGCAPCRTENRADAKNMVDPRPRPSIYWSRLQD